MIEVETQYLEHEGGTKFYETVLMKADDGQAMLIKRYGTLKAKKGGGQQIIERGDIRAMRRERDTILKQKRGKGYDDARGLQDYGLHKITGTGKSMREVVDYAKQHYSANEPVEAIETYFSGQDAQPIPAAPVAAAAPPAPEPDRGDAWGCF